MSGLCDVNFLLALCYGKHVHHPSAKTFVHSIGEKSLVVCRIAQLGLLRLLNNPAVMQGDVCTGQQSWDIYRKLMSDRRFAFAAESPTLEQKLSEFTIAFNYTPKLWQDAYLAAFAVTATLELVTFDRDFRKFSGLSVRLIEETTPAT